MTALDVIAGRRETAAALVVCHICVCVSAFSSVCFSAGYRHPLLCRRADLSAAKNTCVQLRFASAEMLVP